jgi:hypothetical protein
LERAYYHCSHCERGSCPRDHALGLLDSALSPGVLRMVGLVGAMVSFEEGDALLRGLAGLEVGSKQVERSAKALGEAIDRDERAHVEALGPPCAPTMYLGVDGTGIPMRAADLEGRAGKQPDGSAKTREVKLCVVWSAEGRDPEGKPVRDDGSLSYSAAIESAASTDTDFSASAFAQRVLREAHRRGFAKAKRRCILGVVMGDDRGARSFQPRPRAPMAVGRRLRCGVPPAAGRDSPRHGRKCGRGGGGGLRPIPEDRPAEAKAFELRAATSLVRLWQRPGKRDAARALLAEIYGWFTEGFDTRDLIEAKALPGKL